MSPSDMGSTIGGIKSSCKKADQNHGQPSFAGVALVSKKFTALQSHWELWGGSGTPNGKHPVWP
jgi:hypothetical protein